MLSAVNTTSLSGVLSPNVSEFLTGSRPYDDTKPKAYLNWILFDEQFNFVSSSSGVLQVEPGAEKQALVAPLQTIPKNGFLYVYVSNESPQDVYFDDITVQHFTGPLLQEQSYYPFGLEMSGISSKAVLKTLSAYKYNAGSEFEDEGGLNYYNTFYRKYDAQIGRFTGVDILSEQSFSMSVYSYAANNPVFFNDPSGARNIRRGEHGAPELGAPWPQPFSRMRMQDDGWFDNVGGPGGSSGGSSVDGGFSFSGSQAQEVFSALTQTYNNANDDGEWEFSVGSHNGKIGYWSPFDPGEGNAAGNGLLAEVKVGTRFISNSDEGNSDQDDEGITFPSFSTLWNNYPHDVNGEHSHPSTNPAYGNQCAIRMSDCLIKSGVPLIGYPKDDLDKDYGKWALTANRLKYYLSQNNSNFVKVSQADFESKYWNQTGIIYIAPPAGGVGHIDLFNQGTTGSGYYLGAQIWFWPIK